MVITPFRNCTVATQHECVVQGYLKLAAVFKKEIAAFNVPKEFEFFESQVC